MGSVLLALLPIPFAALDLLPTYFMHARFLIFFAPVACFLEVAYIFYVRDLLARLLFRYALDPPPDDDPYYRPRLRDLADHVRTLGIALLPLAFMALSLYCLRQYTARFELSVELAETQMFDQLTPAARRAFLLPAKRVADSSARAPGKPKPDTTSASGEEVADKHINRPALREYVLSQAGIQDIPLFEELTAWYIGMFFSAIGAALVMMLKEHAKETLRISEEMLMFGEATPPE